MADNIEVIARSTHTRPHLQTLYFDEFLEAIHNEHILVQVHPCNVSCVQPTIRIYSVLSSLLIVEVTLHYLWALHTQLPFPAVRLHCLARGEINDFGEGVGDGNPRGAHHKLGFGRNVSHR